MVFNWYFEWNLIQVMFMLLAWGFLAYGVWRIYQTQNIAERPVLWKLIIAVLIGLFSFSINLPLFEGVFSIAILPLGVWILYAMLKGKNRWDSYRKYAWLGFLWNYFFLGAALLAIGVSGVIYPKHEVETYLDDVSKAELLSIHPSGKEVHLNVMKLEESLSSFTWEQSNVTQWYEEIREQMWSNEEDKEQKNVQEKFPYLLTDVKAKAGKKVRVYVEYDGKGLLVTTKDNQYYFRSNNATFLKERGSANE
ncbi:hypothetical protein [Metabacillus litoralis]|uniref:hypothetical protein n=1 Tax=Metabacillus litoralis TaxID=152268 RepID=UPI001CFCA89E|nr:hypothetical protein [Metabacillus litoralis]